MVRFVTATPTRTASHDRILEWETSAQERSVGETMNGARGVFKKIALGACKLSDFASNLGSTVVLAGEGRTCDGGDENSQGWGMNEKIRIVCGWVGKSVVLKKTRIEKEGKAKKTAGKREVTAAVSVFMVDRPPSGTHQQVWSN